MGDVEQLVAEPEEGDVAQDVEGLHPSTLNQHNPWVISQIITSVTSTLEANGWYILGFLVLCYAAKVKLQPKISAWQRKRDEAEELAAVHKNPDKYLARELAIEKARQRLQDQYSQRAEQWAEKHKEKQEELEAKKRREKIEDWERHERGEGYRNKSRLAASATPASVPTANQPQTNKKDGKPKLRPEYNPMTGDIGGGSCRWRPDRRGPSGGG